MRKPCAAPGLPPLRRPWRTEPRSSTPPPQPAPVHHPQPGRLIHQAMGRLIKKRPRFIFAHSFCTIRNADMILVMEQGRLAEMVA
jgi:hypothetical protein